MRALESHRACQLRGRGVDRTSVFSESVIAVTACRDVFANLTCVSWLNPRWLLCWVSTHTVTPRLGGGLNSKVASPSRALHRLTGDAWLCLFLQGGGLCASGHQLVNHYQPVRYAGAQVPTTAPGDEYSGGYARREKQNCLGRPGKGFRWPPPLSLGLVSKPQ